MFTSVCTLGTYNFNHLWDFQEDFKHFQIIVSGFYMSLSNDITAKSWNWLPCYCVNQRSLNNFMKAKCSSIKNVLHLSDVCDYKEYSTTA